MFDCLLRSAKFIKLADAFNMLLRHSDCFYIDFLFMREIATLPPQHSSFSSRLNDALFCMSLLSPFLLTLRTNDS